MDASCINSEDGVDARGRKTRNRASLPFTIFSHVASVGVASLEGLVAPLSHANRSRIFPWPELLPKN